MNNIFKNTLLIVEEFANKSNRLSLAADSILDRIIPKGTASAGCWKYRTVWDNSCLYCQPYSQGKKKTTQKRFCDTPYPYTCANTPHCGTWTTISVECFQC